MALPAVANVFRLQYNFGLGAALGGVHQYWRYSGGPPSNSDAVAIAGEANSLFGTNLKSLLSIAYQLNNIVFTDLSSSSGVMYEDTAAVPGTRSGTNNPANCCVVVDNLISRRYRGGKPRQYWPFGNVGDLTTSQHWNSTFTTAVATGLNAFTAAMEAYGGASISIVQQVNISYYSGFTNYTGSGGRAKVRNNPRATPLVDSITSLAPRIIVGSQRRRLIA